MANSWNNVQFSAKAMIRLKEACVNYDRFVSGCSETSASHIGSVKIMYDPAIPTARRPIT